jgi:hypothetical protein
MPEREPSAWDVVRPLRQWARENSAHAQWIAEGAPRLTDLEHLERFGVKYVKPKGKSTTKGERHGR